MSVDFFSNLNGGTLTLSDDFQKELGKVFKGSTETVLRLLDNDDTNGPQTLDDGVQILTSEKWGDVTVDVDEDVCTLLGIDDTEAPGEKVTISYGDFVSKCFDKMSSAFKEGEIDLDKLEGSDIEMLCLLLCQSSKDKLVNILKNALAAGIDERNTLNSKLIAETAKLAEEQIKAAAAAKKAKTRNIFKSIFGAVAAVVAVVAAAAAVVATAGVCGAPLVAACVGLGLSIFSATCAVTTAGLSIGAMYTSNEKLKARLDKANMVIGITGAVAGLIAVGFSGYGLCKAGKVLSDAVKAVQAVAQGGDILVQLAEGSLGVADGLENIKLADKQRDIENININLEKINQTIEALTQRIDMLKDFIQIFIQNILESESSLVKAQGDHATNVLNLAASPV